MTITEISSRRRTYGHDETAINKHSVRIYRVTGVKKQGTTERMDTWEFHLNRTLDGCPPFYCLYFHRQVSAHPIYLNVSGEQYWGKGLSWPKAEQQAFAAITAFMETK